ncbi:Cyanophycinase, partial [human gut metagenome]
MHNVELHILTNGNKFDLIKRSPFEQNADQLYIPYKT